MSASDRSPGERAGALSSRATLLLPALGGVMGLAWYVQVIGVHTLNPTELGWLGSGDSAAHLLGWLYFRNEPAALPLGTITGLLHPAGTTLGFTDANPWVSLLLRPFSAWLPADFQFIGIWLALCFALLGVFGAGIMTHVTPVFAHRLLGTAIFVLTPPILIRTGHDTLSAHWLLLALIWLHLRPPQAPRRVLAWAFGLNAFAAGVHPYLAAMLVPLTIALFIRMHGESPGLRRSAVALASCGLLLQTTAIFALLGYLDEAVPPGLYGFGLYSADMLTFVNALGHSRWMPSLPIREWQYEGFAYLGLGVLALAAVCVVQCSRARQWPRVPRRYRPLVVAAGLMGIFALSHTVTVAGYVVLTMRTASASLLPLLEPFRASGRFIWPLFYVVVTGIIVLVVRRGGTRPLATTALLLAAVVLQASEVAGAWPGPRSARLTFPALAAPAWDEMGPPYRHLVLFPPWYVTGPAHPRCEASPFSYQPIVSLSYQAYRAGLTINSAYVARHPADALAAYCQSLAADVRAGRFAADTVYIVTGESRARMTSHPDLTCGTLDGFDVCVATATDHPFRRALLAAGLADLDENADESGP